jgi:regulatory Fis family protein
MNALPDPQARDEIVGYHGAVSDFKRRLIEATLHQARGNRTHAARSLGLQRTYLLRLIRELRVAAPPPPSRHDRARPEAANGLSGTPAASAEARPTSAPSPTAPASYPPARAPARVGGRGVPGLSR